MTNERDISAIPSQLTVKERADSREKAMAELNVPDPENNEDDDEEDDEEAAKA